MLRVSSVQQVQRGGGATFGASDLYKQSFFILCNMFDDAY